MKDKQELREELERARMRITFLEDELEKTQQGFNALLLEMEKKVEKRTSKLKSTKKLLNKNLARYRDLFHGTGDAIYVHDTDGNLLNVNTEAVDRLGYSEKEFSSMSLCDIRPNGGEIPVPDSRNKSMSFETIHITESGEEIPVEVRATRIEYDGELAVMSVARDISRRKRTKLELKNKDSKLKSSFKELAETTSRVLGVRDPYTEKHALRVGGLAREVGINMGLGDDKLLGLYLGGVLHDIGKIAIPETILTKPGELKKVEWDMIKSHPEVGYKQILEDTDFPWPVAEMVLHHHERLDGSGYPDGLKANDLTLEVRIIGACDVVEAMSTRRPYREARTKERTVEVIEEGKGEKFDPEISDILIEMIKEDKIEFGSG